MHNSPEECVTAYHNLSTSSHGRLLALNYPCLWLAIWQILQLLTNQSAAVCGLCIKLLNSDAEGEKVWKDNRGDKLLLLLLKKFELEVKVVLHRKRELVYLLVPHTRTSLQCHSHSTMHCHAKYLILFNTNQNCKRCTVTIAIILINSLKYIDFYKICFWKVQDLP